MKELINEHIQNLTPYDPVDPNEKFVREYGIDPNKIIRLNANENPFGPLEGMSDLISGTPVNIYPDSNQDSLRTALSGYTGIEKKKIVAGSGADELIELLFKIFCTKGDRIVDIEPTFGMYSFLAGSTGMEVLSIKRDSDWNFDVSKLKSLISQNNVKILFLASPNNPTGNLVDLAELKQLLEIGLIVVVDETYYEFSNSSVVSLCNEYKNLIVLRSFSKWAGIAGLRIGYVIASEEIIENIFKVKQPYNVNVIAEKAAIMTLENINPLLNNIKIILEERSKFERFIDQLEGVKFYPSHGNFTLCKFTKKSSDFIFNNLAREGIFVRCFSEEMIKDCLRITIGTTGQMDKVKIELEKIITK